VKRFRFSLERVLEFRRQQEEVERALLARIATERTRLEQLAQQQQIESRELRAVCVAEGVAVGAHVRQAYDSAAALLRRRTRSLELAGQAEQLRLQQLATVLDARRRLRLLELLRDRQRRRHVRSTDRALEAAAAELYLAKLRR